MTLIEIASRLEDQGCDVRQEYWAVSRSHPGPTVVVHVAGGSSNRPIEKVTYDKENDLIVVEVPS